MVKLIVAQQVDSEGKVLAQVELPHDEDVDQAEQAKNAIAVLTREHGIRMLGAPGSGKAIRIFVTEDRDQG